MESTVTLRDGMAFDVAVGGHHLVIDAGEAGGGRDEGPTPKPLVLSALAGCGAMDVVSILRKMRQPFTTFRVRAEAEPVDSHPKVLVDFVVTYEIEGEVDPRKLWRAVALSRDTYCGVSAMLVKHSPITYRVVLNGEVVAEPG